MKSFAEKIYNDFIKGKFSFQRTLEIKNARWKRA